MYHRFAFYALFPLLAFVALLIPIAWLVKLIHISIGMFPWSIILGVGVLPIFVAGTACCSGGLIALWLFLRWPRKYARFICVLPLSFIPIAIYLGQFLAKFVSELGSMNLFIQFDVLSLQAHLLYPIIALALVALTWVKKSASPETQTNSRATALQTLAMWSLVLPFWALSAFAVISTEGYVKQYLAQLRIVQEHVIDSDNDQPIVVAICAGQIERAKQLIKKDGKTLSEGDISTVIESCLKKRSGDLRTHTPPPFYVDRVAVTLQAILAYEETHKVLIQNGCSTYRSQLLEKIYQDNVNELGLQVFTNRGLPINCLVKLNDGNTYPVWWQMVYGPCDGRPDKVSYDKLIRLEKLGISLLETDSRGNQFFSTDWNSFHEKTEDRALLYLIERGLDMRFIDQNKPPLNIELIQRRFGYRDSDPDSADFKALLALVGEPSQEQLVFIKTHRSHYLPERQESDPRSVAMHDYIDQRLALLNKKSSLAKGTN